MALGGDHQLSFDANVNFFDSVDPPSVSSAVCVTFDVLFASEGDITFGAVGCDFIV